MPLTVGLVSQITGGTHQFSPDFLPSLKSPVEDNVTSSDLLDGDERVDHPGDGGDGDDGGDGGDVGEGGDR